MIIINCDGTVNADRTRAGYAYLMWRDGSLVAQEFGRVPVEWGTTSNVGEYYAVLRGLQTLTKAEWEKHEIVVRSDSQLIIYQLTGAYQVTKPHLRKLRDAILHLVTAKAPKTKNVHFKWVRRERNKEADALSRRVFTKGAP